MIFKLKVKTFCSTCNANKDSSEKLGHLIGYIINENAYLCTIFFDKCGHKRVAILTPNQIDKMEEAVFEKQTR